MLLIMGKKFWFSEHLHLDNFTCGHFYVWTSEIGQFGYGNICSGLLTVWDFRVYTVTLQATVGKSSGNLF